MRKKRKQTSKEKKLEERIEKLRQQGFYFPPNIQSPNKETPKKQTRLIRRFADWWETTFLEKILEDIEYLLKNSAILSILSFLANVALIVSLVSWLTGFEKRKEEQLFSTWTIINDGKGDKSGIVKKAVERLHKDKFSLSGLELNETNLSGANLSGARLSKANLSGANLSGTDLSEANLSGADLSKANLREAKLNETDLSQANLHGTKLILASLSKANLFGADLTKADLYRANLSEAYLIGTDLPGTNLSETNLTGIDLSGADLRKANLSGANLSGVNLSEANLSGVNLFNIKSLSNAQIKLACNWKEAIYVNSRISKDKNIFITRIPIDKQANQDRIKEIEQDKDSDPENPPDCSIWEQRLTKLY